MGKREVVVVKPHVDLGNHMTSTINGAVNMRSNCYNSISKRTILVRFAIVSVQNIRILKDYSQANHFAANFTS